MTFATTGWGQISLSSGSSASEGFNVLGTSTTAALPTNWKASKSTTARDNPGSYASAVAAVEQAAGNSMSTSAGNGIYRYNANNSTSESAIGGVSSGSASKSVFLYGYFKNTGATAISSLTISYDVEQYRAGSNPFSIELFYSIDGSTWTACGSNFVTAPTANATVAGYPTAPGATYSVSGKSYTPASPISANTSFYLAWRYSCASGTTTSNAQAFGVDNIVVAAPSASPTITLNPTSLSGLTTTTGANSSVTNYTVMGANLGTTNIIVTPNSSLIEVSTNASSGFATNALTLTQTGGVVSNTVYVRIASNSEATNINSTISHVSGSASTNLTVTGTVSQGGVAPVVTAATINGTVGVSMETNVIASGSPTNYSILAGTMPGGLSLTAGTGAITGTPTNATSNSVVTIIAANSAGNGTNNLTFNIAKGTQTITGLSPNSIKSTTNAPYPLSATASSGLGVSYASSNTNVATISESTVTIVGAGTSTITASQAGDSNWNPASDVTQTLTVTAPPVSLTLTTTPSPMSGFNAALGSNSDVQTLNVVGLNLVNDVVISPVAGFEFSTDGITYVTNGLTLPKGDGGLTNDISVRMVSSAAGGLLGGSITVGTATNGTNSLVSSKAVRGAVGVYWDFTTASPATNAVPQDWTLGPVTQGNIFGSVVMLSSTSANALGVYTGASSGANAQIAAQVGALSLSNSAYFEIPIVVPDTDTNTLTDYGIQKIVFGSRATSTGPQKYTIRTSQDNYASDIASGILGNNSLWAAYTNNNLGLILSKGTNTVRIYGSDGAGNPGSGSANWRIDDLVMTLGSVINTNPTLSFLPGNIGGLKGFTGSPSLSSSYVVKGTNLLGNLNLQVSTNAIQISTDNTTFTNQLTLNPTNGVLSNTVYVRLSSEAALGPVTGTVQNVSGTLTNTLSVVGTVYDAARGGSAATLAGWDVNDQVGGTGNFGPSPLAPTIKNSDVIVGGMTRGSGVETSTIGAGRAWGGTTWENTNSVDAIANGKFVTFTLQATSGKTLSLTSLPKFNYRAAGSYGPTSGLIQYQIGSGAFQDVTQVTYTANGNGQALSPVNLSGIQDLQNVPASRQITFRIVNWGGQTNPNPAFPGSWYIFDTAVTPDIDFEVTGSVADALPAPTGLSYTTSSVNATALTPIASLSPTLTTGSEITYSIDPALPEGLVINPLTGVISGTPSAAAASTIYTVTASNTGGSTTTTLTIVVDAVPADTTAPVITRIGNASIVVAWGDSYTDAGATATDNVDSSVTVTSSGSVNTAVPGTYTITYNATDAANNNATPVTRTVTVSAPSSEVGADGLSGLLRYAFGANGPSDTVTKPTSTLSAGKLAITAIVRTNNPNLTVVGQAVTNLPNYASGTSIVGADVARDVDQTNVTNGCERQTFSVEQGTDAKKFLRLKATLNP